MTTTAIVPLGEMDRMAEAIAKSGLFGMKTKDQALALMIVAQSENRHPGSVAAEYHIIQGRPALKADAMLARFQLAGGLVEWQDYTDKKVSAKFSHSVNSPTPVLIEWTLEMATKAGLTGKDNWKNYPRQMLRARVVSEGVRTVYPAVCVGVYTPEEVQDFEPAEHGRRPRKEKEINPIDERAAGGTPPSAHPLAADAASAPAVFATTDALIAKAREFAECGTTTYAAFFEGLTGEQQKVLGKKRHDELWAIAEKFDKVSA